MIVTRLGLTFPPQLNKIEKQLVIEDMSPLYGDKGFPEAQRVKNLPAIQETQEMRV